MASELHWGSSPALGETILPSGGGVNSEVDSIDLLSLQFSPTTRVTFQLHSGGFLNTYFWKRHAARLVSGQVESISAKIRIGGDILDGLNFESRHITSGWSPRSKKHGQLLESHMEKPPF